MRAAMERFYTEIEFASDAKLAAIWGGVFVVLSLLALWGDARRTRRKEIDQVGWFPWTKLFFACAFIGAGLIMLAVKSWGGE